MNPRHRRGRSNEELHWRKEKSGKPSFWPILSQGCRLWPWRRGEFGEVRRRTSVPRGERHVDPWLLHRHREILEYLRRDPTKLARSLIPAANLAELLRGCRPELGGPW